MNMKLVLDHCRNLEDIGIYSGNIDEVFLRQLIQNNNGLKNLQFNPSERESDLATLEVALSLVRNWK